MSQRGVVKTPVAESIPFDNNPEGTPIFTESTPENLQEAIEASGEKGQLALDTPRYSLTLLYNGVIGNNTFLGYSNLLPGDQTPVIIPVKSSVFEFTFSNSRTNADYTLELRKGSTTATPFYTVSKTNTQFFVESGLSEEFNPGDAIYIKYLDNGNNARDGVFVLFLKALP